MTFRAPGYGGAPPGFGGPAAGAGSRPAPARPSRRERARRILLVVVAAVMILGAAGIFVFVGFAQGPTALLLGLGLATIPVPVLVAAFMWLDRYEPEPVRYLLFALGWGAVFATVLAVLLSFAVERLAGSGFTVGGVVVAPVVEEGCKAAVIVLIAVLRRHEFDGLVDGIVYAGMVGIGFAFTENILYYGGAYVEAGGADQGLLAAQGVFIIRGIFAPFAHPLFTLATGLAIGFAVRRRSWVARLLLPLAGYAVAVALHAGWNASALLGGPAGFVLTYLLVMVPAFGLALGFAVWLRVREGRVLAARLAEYAAVGWLHPAEVPWLAGLRLRAVARRHAQRVYGDPVARAVQQYQRVGTELGFLRDRLLRGVAGKGAAEREQELLARLTAWRPFIRLPPPLAGPPVRPQLGPPPPYSPYYRVPGPERPRAGPLSGP